MTDAASSLLPKPHSLAGWRTCFSYVFMSTSGSDIMFFTAHLKPFRQSYKIKKTLVASCALLLAHWKSSRPWHCCLSPWSLPENLLQLEGMWCCWPFPWEVLQRKCELEKYGHSKWGITIWRREILKSFQITSSTGLLPKLALVWKA